jgi:hypothetical protein
LKLLRRIASPRPSPAKQPGNDNAGPDSGRAGASSPSDRCEQVAEATAAPGGASIAASSTLTGGVAANEDQIAASSSPAPAEPGASNAAPAASGLAMPARQEEPLSPASEQQDASSEASSLFDEDDDKLRIGEYNMAKAAAALGGDLPTRAQLKLKDMKRFIGGHPQSVVAGVSRKVGGRKSVTGQSRTAMHIYDDLVMALATLPHNGKPEELGSGASRC